jgi:hypothetical protein
MNIVHTASGDDKKFLQRSPPRIVKTEPAAGAVDVKTRLTEIVVTFDQDMLPGYSWMSGPAFPKTTGKPFWRGKRVCVLPVELERGRFYRVGFNSSEARFQNFTNEDAGSALPRVLWFVTEGATDAEKAKAVVPRIAATVPANGATDVDPMLSAVTVTFDRPMSSGMSWAGYSAKFPRGIAPAHWKDDRRTCVFPVQLLPAREYEIGINDDFYINFQSADGVPVAPAKLRFTTRGGKTSGGD